MERDEAVVNEVVDDRDSNAGSVHSSLEPQRPMIERVINHHNHIGCVHIEHMHAPLNYLQLFHPEPATTDDGTGPGKRKPDGEGPDGGPPPTRTYTRRRPQKDVPAEKPAAADSSSAVNSTTTVEGGLVAELDALFGKSTAVSSTTTVEGGGV